MNWEYQNLVPFVHSSNTMFPGLHYEVYVKNLSTNMDANNMVLASSPWTPSLGSIHSLLLVKEIKKHSASYRVQGRCIGRMCTEFYTDSPLETIKGKIIEDTVLSDSASINARILCDHIEDLTSSLGRPQIIDTLRRIEPHKLSCLVSGSGYLSPELEKSCLETQDTAERLAILIETVKLLGSRAKKIYLLLQLQEFKLRRDMAN